MAPDAPRFNGVALGPRCGHADFFFVDLAPDDPAYILAGEGATPGFLAHIRAEHGLDHPLASQFVAFLTRAATGDFGTSIYFHSPVFAVILERFPATVVAPVPG